METANKLAYKYNKEHRRVLSDERLRLINLLRVFPFYKFMIRWSLKKLIKQYEFDIKSISSLLLMIRFIEYDYDESWE